MRHALALRQLAALAIATLGGATLLAAALSPPAFLSLAIAGFVIAASVPILLALRRGIDAGDAMGPFVLYFVLAMGVRGISLLTWEDSFYLQDVQDPRSLAFQSLMGWMFFYSALGLAAVMAGQRSRAARALGDRIALRLAAGGRWPDARVTRVCVAMLAAGTLGALLYVHALGGFAAASTNLVFVATDGSLGNFWQLALMEFAVVGFHVLCVHELSRPGGRARWGLLALCSAPLVALFLVTSSKFLLLRIFVPPLLFFHFLKRRLSVLHLAAFFVLFGALFPVFYAYRAFGLGDPRAIAEQLTAGDPDASWLAAAPLLGRAYDADSFVAVLHRTGTLVPFRFGGSLAGLVNFFVPRAWWPDKPMSYSLQFADQYFGDVNLGGMNYVSPSLVGELYLNFHVAGIVAGCFAVGVLIAAALRLAQRGGAAGVLIHAYLFLLAIHLVEGSLAAQIEFALLDIGPAWIAIVLLRRRSPGVVRKMASVPRIARRSLSLSGPLPAHDVEC